jgi:hypothetical protein
MDSTQAAYANVLNIAEGPIQGNSTAWVSRLQARFPSIPERVCSAPGALLGRDYVADVENGLGARGRWIARTVDHHVRVGGGRIGRPVVLLKNTISDGVVSNFSNDPSRRIAVVEIERSTEAVLSTYSVDTSCRYAVVAIQHPAKPRSAMHFAVIRGNGSAPSN